MSVGRLGPMVGAAPALLFTSLACCCGVPDAVREGLQGSWPWTVVRGSGDVVEEARGETGFSGVSLRGIGHLTIELGESESIIIEAEDNLMPYLESGMEGTVLVVGTKPGVNLRPTRPIVIRVTLRDLDSLEVSGSGDAEGEGLQVGDLSVVVTGSGNVVLSELEAGDLTVRIYGSGSVDLDGQSNSQELAIRGSGDYHARGLATAEADVRISGSGSAALNVSDRLDAVISGSGSVRYLGSPSVRSSVTGSGSIQQVGD